MVGLEKDVNKETRRVFLEEMTGTRGWEIVKDELLSRRKQAIHVLVDGSPSNIDMQDVIVNRARVRLIDEILNSIAKEDNKW